LLSLILPMMMSGYAPSDVAVRKSGMKIVWIGLGLITIAILVIKFWEAAAFYAFVIGSASYIFCAFVLRRKLRAAKRAAQT
jgi:F0F1-type ATP synthase assembly protein I